MQRLLHLLLLSWWWWAPAITTAQPTTQPAETLEDRAFRLTQDHPYDPIIYRAARAEKLDPFILKGLLYEESHLSATIINRISGAAGIGQFTRAGRAGLNRIRRARDNLEEFTYSHSFNPQKAIPAAAELLGYLINRWGRNYGIASYNGGKYKRYFMLKVLRQVNRYRVAAGLPPLSLPSHPPALLARS